MPRAKTKRKVSQELEIADELIRERAYLKWLAKTNGTPVSDLESLQFWVEAEEEMLQEVKKELE